LIHIEGFLGLVDAVSAEFLQWRHGQNFIWAYCQDSSTFWNCVASYADIIAQSLVVQQLQLTAW